MDEGCGTHLATCRHRANTVSSAPIDRERQEKHEDKKHDPGGRGGSAAVFRPGGKG